MVLMMGPRPVAVGEGARARAGDATGEAAGDGTSATASGESATTGDAETMASPRVLLLALATEPGRAPSSGRSMGFEQAKLSVVSSAPKSTTRWEVRGPAAG